MKKSNQTRMIIRGVMLAAIPFAVSSVSHAETITGTVLAADGTPAAGAKVWCGSLTRYVSERVETKADGTGQFSLELGEGPWLLFATLGDQGYEGQEILKIERGKTNKPQTIHLKPQGLLRVQMTEEETGRPIVGGKLVLDNALEPMTDKDGRLEVNGMIKSHYHECFVVAPGRERKQFLFEMSEKPITDLELIVPRGGKVIGRVLDSNTKPVAGALVGRSDAGKIINFRALWVVADAEGRFVYDGFPHQTKSKDLSARAGVFLESKQTIVVADPDGPPVELEFQLQLDPAKAKVDAGRDPAKAVVKGGETRTIRGTILGPDEKPVPNAVVRWGISEPLGRIESKTNIAGKFELALVPNRPGNVSVLPESDELAAGVTSVVALGDVQLDWTIGNGHSVKGVVQDMHGNPFEDVGGFPVVAKDNDPMRRGLFLLNRAVGTDAKGRFEVKGVPKTDVKFLFRGRSVNDLLDQVLDFDKENIVVIKSKGAIRGKVADNTGKPVRNFRIQFFTPKRLMPNDLFTGVVFGFRDPGLTFTSDDGSFIIRELDSETVVGLTAVAPGHEPVVVDRVFIKPADEKTPEDVVTIRVP